MNSSNEEKNPSGVAIESPVSPEQGLPMYLECAMCGAPNSFVISPLDPAVGYCFKEQKAWRINSLTCATRGCLRPKATFGDHCMSCLEDRVNDDDAVGSYVNADGKTVAI